MTTLWWVVRNAAYFACAVGLSYLLFRSMPRMLRFVMAAWAVVAVKYLAFIATMTTQAALGSVKPRMVLQWAVLTPFSTLPAVLVCIWFVWRKQFDWATFALVAVATNWILFEVVGTALALLTWPFWMWGVPVLSLVTVTGLGATAAMNVAGHRTRG